MSEQDGRVFVMLPLRGNENRLIVTEGAVGFDPNGDRILEAEIPEGTGPQVDEVSQP
jgi:hypothetical protein